VRADPFTVRAGGKSKYVVSFLPDDQAATLVQRDTPLAWLTHVDARLLSGASLTAWHRLNDDAFSEVILRPGDAGVDLLVDEPRRGASIEFGRAIPAGAELCVHGFTCQSLVDDEPEDRALPFSVPISFEPGWAQFYGEVKCGLVHRLRYYRFRRLTKPRVLPWLGGLEVTIVPGEEMSQAVYVSGLYEPCTTSVLERLLSPGGTFIDVGAHVGLLTMVASRRVGAAGHVFSFEPSTREFERLERHLDRNRLDNVLPVHAALGSREERKSLHVASPSRSGLNTFNPRFNYGDVAEAYTESVSVMRLDDFVLAHGISKVDAIKIDVEGDESDVVMGATNTIARDRPAIVIEVNASRSAPDDSVRTRLESLLRSLHYEFVAIDGDTGTLRRVPDFCLPAENFLAAQPGLVDALLNGTSKSRLAT